MTLEAQIRSLTNLTESLIARLEGQELEMSYEESTALEGFYTAVQKLDALLTELFPDQKLEEQQLQEVS